MGLKRRELMKANKTIETPCEKEEVSYLNHGITRVKAT